jgi:putative ABC transport system substrate-binding protein
MATHIRRRELIAALGGATVAWPLVGRAQQPAMPVVGFLGTTTPDDFMDRVAAFREGLKDSGYVEGRNVLVEYRWPEGHYDRLPSLAADLCAVREPSALAAKAATTTIPIVFSIGGDPVRVGLVASLNRPGGNVTGLSLQQTDVAGKRLELLREVVLGLHRLVIIGNVGNPFTVLEMREVQVAASRLGLEVATPEIRRAEDIARAGTGTFGAIQAVAPALGVEVTPIGVHDIGAIERAMEAFARSANGGLIVTGPAIVPTVTRDLIITLAARHKLPAVYPIRELVTAGGLVSYGPDISDSFRRAAGYIDRILKGAKPADLPVQAPTKYELVINLKTAKALGLDVPASVLARADEVLE